MRGTASTLKTEAVTSVRKACIYQTTRRRFPEGGNVNIHRRHRMKWWLYGPQEWLEFVWSAVELCNVSPQVPMAAVPHMMLLMSGRVIPSITQLEVI